MMNDKQICHNFARGHSVRRSEFHDNSLVFLNNVLIHIESFLYSEISELHRQCIGEKEYHFIIIYLCVWPS